MRTLLMLLAAALWSPPAAAQLRVVSTNTIVGDWVEQLEGEWLENQTLLPTGVDPHIYEPVPADSRAIETADLIVFNGHNLEPGLERLIIESAAVTLPLAEALPETVLIMAGGAPDPHVWGDVSLAIAMVGNLRDTLIELTPDYTEVITTAATTYLETLTALHSWVGEQVATIPAAQRQLVTTHDAFAYYSRAYGLNPLGTLIGISTEEQPSAQTVARLVRTIQAANVPAIFAETTINPVLITTVANEAGVRLADRKLYADSLGSEEAATYVEMLIFNTETLVSELGGTITPWVTP